MVIIFRSQKGFWYKDDYMMFGSYHADIDLNAVPNYKLSKLIVHMSQYDNMGEFNETMDRQRRDNSYTNSEIYDWNWDSDENRNKFNEIRIKSSNLKKINNFTISALLINRLISFFNTIYLSDKKYNFNSSIYPLNDDGLTFYFNIIFNSFYFNKLIIKFWDLKNAPVAQLDRATAFSKP